MITLKIIIEEPQDGEEEQIIVKCRNIRPELLNLLNSFKPQNNMLIGYINNEIHRIYPADIYYIETVDNRTFLYSEHKVYESRQKLYELDEILSAGNFFRE